MQTSAQPLETRLPRHTPATVLGITAMDHAAGVIGLTLAVQGEQQRVRITKQDAEWIAQWIADELSRAPRCPMDHNSDRPTRTMRPPYSREFVPCASPAADKDAALAETMRSNTATAISGEALSSNTD